MMTSPPEAAAIKVKADQELAENFHFYVRFAKPLVLNLTAPNERVLAAAWVQKLCDGSFGTEQLRTDYLKLLLFVLQKGRLFGPFTKNPNETALEDFGLGVKLRDVAKSWLETEENVKRRKMMLGLTSEYPPVSAECSGDLLEYAAAQDIPNFGVHAYYAFSSDPITNWEHLEKGIFPRGALSAVKKSESQSAISDHKTRSSRTKSRDRAFDPRKKSRSRSRSRSKVSRSSEDIAGESGSKKVVTFKDGERIERISFATNRTDMRPSSSPLGSFMPTDERNIPTWGSNLISVSDPPQHEELKLPELDKALEGVEDQSVMSAHDSAMGPRAASTPNKDFDFDKPDDDGGPFEGADEPEQDEFDNDVECRPCSIHSYQGVMEAPSYAKPPDEGDRGWKTEPNIRYPQWDRSRQSQTSDFRRKLSFQDEGTRSTTSDGPPSVPYLSTGEEERYYTPPLPQQERDAYNPFQRAQEQYDELQSVCPGISAPGFATGPVPQRYPSNVSQSQSDSSGEFSRLERMLEEEEALGVCPASHGGRSFQLPTGGVSPVFMEEMPSYLDDSSIMRSYSDRQAINRFDDYPSYGLDLTPPLPCAAYPDRMERVYDEDPSIGLDLTPPLPGAYNVPSYGGINQEEPDYSGYLDPSVLQAISPAAPCTPKKSPYCKRISPFYQRKQQTSEKKKVDPAKAIQEQYNSLFFSDPGLEPFYEPCGGLPLPPPGPDEDTVLSEMLAATKSPCRRGKAKLKRAKTPPKKPEEPPPQPHTFQCPQTGISCMPPDASCDDIGCADGRRPSFSSSQGTAYSQPGPYIPQKDTSYSSQSGAAYTTPPGPSYMPSQGASYMSPQGLSQSNVLEKSKVQKQYETLLNAPKDYRNQCSYSTCIGGPSAADYDSGEDFAEIQKKMDSGVGLSRGPKEKPKPKLDQTIEDVIDHGISTITPEPHDIVDDAMAALYNVRSVHTLEEMYAEQDAAYPERRPDVERTPPVFSNVPGIREGPGQTIRYSGVQFGVSETQRWIGGEEYLKDVTEFSPFHDPREERKQEPKEGFPNIQELSFEILTADDELDYFDEDKLLTPTPRRHGNELQRRIKELMSDIHDAGVCLPAMGGVALTTPRKSPVPVRTYELDDLWVYGETMPGYLSPDVSAAMIEQLKAQEQPQDQVSETRFGTPEFLREQRKEQGRSPVDGLGISLAQPPPPLETAGFGGTHGRQPESPQKQPSPQQQARNLGAIPKVPRTGKQDTKAEKDKKKEETGLKLMKGKEDRFRRSVTKTKDEEPIKTCKELKEQRKKEALERRKLEEQIQAAFRQYSEMYTSVADDDLAAQAEGAPCLSRQYSADRYTDHTGKLTPKRPTSPSKTPRLTPPQTHPNIFDYANVVSPDLELMSPELERTPPPCGPIDDMFTPCQSPPPQLAEVDEEEQEYQREYREAQEAEDRLFGDQVFGDDFHPDASTKTTPTHLDLAKSHDYTRDFFSPRERGPQEEPAPAPPSESQKKKDKSDKKGKKKAKSDTPPRVETILEAPTQKPLSPRQQRKKAQEDLNSQEERFAKSFNDPQQQNLMRRVLKLVSDVGPAVIAEEDSTTQVTPTFNISDEEQSQRSPCQTPPCSTQYKTSPKAKGPGKQMTMDELMAIISAQEEQLKASQSEVCGGSQPPETSPCLSRRLPPQPSAGSRVCPGTPGGTPRRPDQETRAEDQNRLPDVFDYAGALSPDLHLMSPKYAPSPPIYPETPKRTCQGLRTVTPEDPNRLPNIFDFAGALSPDIGLASPEFPRSPLMFPSPGAPKGRPLSPDSGSPVNIEMLRSKMLSAKSPHRPDYFRVLPGKTAGKEKYIEKYSRPNVPCRIMEDELTERFPSEELPVARRRQRESYYQPPSPDEQPIRLDTPKAGDRGGRRRGMCRKLDFSGLFPTPSTPKIDRGGRSKAVGRKLDFSDLLPTPSTPIIERGGRRKAAGRRLDFSDIVPSPKPLRTPPGYEDMPEYLKDLAKKYRDLPELEQPPLPDELMGTSREIEFHRPLTDLDITPPPAHLPSPLVPRELIPSYQTPPHLRQPRPKTPQFEMKLMPRLRDVLRQTEQLEFPPSPEPLSEDEEDYPDIPQLATAQPFMEGSFVPPSPPCSPYRLKPSPVKKFGPRRSSPTNFDYQRERQPAPGLAAAAKQYQMLLMDTPEVKSPCRGTCGADAEVLQDDDFGVNQEEFEDMSRELPSAPICPGGARSPEPRTPGRSTPPPDPFAFATDANIFGESPPLMTRSPLSPAEEIRRGIRGVQGPIRRRPVELYGYGERESKPIPRKSKRPSLAPHTEVTEEIEDFVYWPGGRKPPSPQQRTPSPRPCRARTPTPPRQSPSPQPGAPMGPMTWMEHIEDLVKDVPLPEEEEPVRFIPSPLQIQPYEPSWEIEHMADVCGGTSIGGVDIPEGIAGYMSPRTPTPRKSPSPQKQRTPSPRKTPPFPCGSDPLLLETTPPPCFSSSDDSPEYRLSPPPQFSPGRDQRRGYPCSFDLGASPELRAVSDAATPPQSPLRMSPTPSPGDSPFSPKSFQRAVRQHEYTEHRGDREHALRSRSMMERRMEGRRRRPLDILPEIEPPEWETPNIPPMRLRPVPTKYQPPMNQSVDQFRRFVPTAEMLFSERAEMAVSPPRDIFEEDIEDPGLNVSHPQFEEIQEGEADQECGPTCQGPPDWEPQFTPSPPKRTPERRSPIDSPASFAESVRQHQLTEDFMDQQRPFANLTIQTGRRSVTLGRKSARPPLHKVRELPEPPQEVWMEGLRSPTQPRDRSVCGGTCSGGVPTVMSERQQVTPRRSPGRSQSRSLPTTPIRTTPVDSPQKSPIGTPMRTPSKTPRERGWLDDSDGDFEEDGEAFGGVCAPGVCDTSPIPADEGTTEGFGWLD